MLNKQGSECASGVKYGSVLNMRALHSVLNMSEHVLTEFWIYIGF